MNEPLFLGETIEFWRELQCKANELGVVDWLKEIATLRGKVSFYESRIKELEDFRKKDN